MCDGEAVYVCVQLFTTPSTCFQLSLEAMDKCLSNLFLELFIFFKQIWSIFLN